MKYVLLIILSAVLIWQLVGLIKQVINIIKKKNPQESNVKDNVINCEVQSETSEEEKDS